MGDQQILFAGGPSLTTVAGLWFIFFTWFMWPFWIPFSAYVLEPKHSKCKHLFWMISLAGLVFGLVLFVPHLINPDWLEVATNQGFLTYDGIMLLDSIMPRKAINTLYLLPIIIPTLLSRYKHIRYFGMSLTAVVGIDYVFLSYAYISFFDLLAGLATIHPIYIISRNKCGLNYRVLFT